jgi:hypothetical protein
VIFWRERLLRVGRSVSAGPKRIVSLFRLQGFLKAHQIMARMIIKRLRSAAGTRTHSLAPCSRTRFD